MGLLWDQFANRESKVKQEIKLLTVADILHIAETSKLQYIIINNAEGTNRANLEMK